MLAVILMLVSLLAGLQVGIHLYDDMAVKVATDLRRAACGTR